MGKKFIYLSTCDTCRKIMKEVGLTEDYVLHDLKKTPLDESTLKYLLKYYEASELVNRRSRKIKELGIDLANLSDAELKNWLLKEYTFIKRPIAIDDKNVFVGNSKAVREALKLHIEQS